MDGAFIVQGDNGFSAEVVWEAKNGTVIITALRAKSAYYGGYWFPDGAVKVNGETVFSMSAGPVSHVFHTVGPDFVDIEVFGDNQRLPVTSGKISGGKATIDVSMYLYSDTESVRPRIAGSAEVTVDSVLPVVHNGTKFIQRQAVANNGTAFRTYRPIVHDGAAWKT